MEKVLKCIFRTFRVYLLLPFLLVGLLNTQSLAIEEIKLSEICNDPADTDSDGIPDSCDCEPDVAADREFEITGNANTCQAEELSYSILINDLVINEVDFVSTDNIELKNYGSESIDILGFKLCANTNCTVIGGIWLPVTDDEIVEPEDYIVGPGSTIRLEGGLFNFDSDVALYKGNENDPNDMLSYVRYAKTEGFTSDRAADAVGQNLWSSTDDYIDVSNVQMGESIEYDGFGNGPSDWQINNSTLGEENTFRTSFIWEFTGGGELRGDNSNTISLDFEGSNSGDLIVYDLKGDDCIRGRSVISIEVQQELSWYLDEDEDGFGDPLSDPIVDCDDPSTEDKVYAPNNEDCVDSDSSINPMLEWFADLDSDALGDPDNSLMKCLDPSDEINYVLNNLDPNDDNVDSDSDGLNDGDEINIHGTNPSLEDSDADGCHDGEEISNATDPNDSDSGAGSLWFADEDKDGFGDALNSELSCSRPSGYVANDSDCDDDDSNIFPNAPARPDGKDNNCNGTIDRIGQIITFGGFNDVPFSNEEIALSAFTSSELPVAFTVTGPAVISADYMTFTGFGTVRVTATQNGNDNYLAAEPVIRSFCVNPPRPQLSIEGNLLTSNTSAGNSWFKDGTIISGESGETITVNDDGNYSVQTNVDGCPSPVSAEVNLGMTTGLFEPGDNDLVVYPNPVLSHLNFDFIGLNLSQNLTIELTDLIGQKTPINPIEVSETNKVVIDVSSLRSGIYFYIIHFKGQLVSQRFIKE